MNLKSNFKTRQKIGIATIFSLSIILAAIFTNGDYGNIFQKENNVAVAVDSVTPEVETLKYFYFTKNVDQKPLVSAEAYMVGDLNTGEIILAKNKDKKFPIASVSKLMTAAVSKEIQNEEELVSIPKKALQAEGANGNLILNEKVKAGDLLYPLLLESSNDAAEAIAIHSDRQTFMAKMNAKAEELGLASTSFEDPSGLSPNNQSSTFDLFMLARYIREKNPELFQLTTNKSYKNKNHVWFSNNQFLRKDGYLGGKSGYIDESRQTVVSLFSLPLGETEAREVAITLLRSNDRAKDVENILKYLKQNIYYGRESDAEAGWVKDKEGIAEVKEPDFVTMAFLGDLMLDRGVKNSVLKNFNGDYSALFDKLEILKKSDVVFANLEGTASDKGKDIGNLYSFQMDPSVIPALKGAGINILSVANNHIGDWGREAYMDTLSRLKENEILYTGGGFSIEEAEKPVVIERHGVKIGFLAFSDQGPNSMSAGREVAGVLLANNPRFDEIIKNAKAQVDHLVVTFHFGDEYQPTHNERQEYLAYKAIDNGAKLVVGTHPHVIEDTEVYKQGYIAYSLGNFIFDQAFSPETMEGMLLHVTLSKNGSMVIKKDILKLNRVFQPDKIIPGKEEKIVFE